MSNQNAAAAATAAAALVSPNNSENDGSDEDEIVVEKTRTLSEILDHRAHMAEQEGRMICVDGETAAMDPHQFVGRRVCKHFEGHGDFFGEIMNTADDVDDEDIVYDIVYDDGDREEVNWEELKPLLEKWERNKHLDTVWAKRNPAKKDKKRSMSKPPRFAPKAVTPTPVKVKREVKVKQERTANNPPTARVNLQHHLGDSPPAAQQQQGEATAALADVKVKMESKLPKGKSRAQDPFRACEWEYDVAWIKLFAEWLEDHDKISRQNARTILRQVTLMAQGQGVGYKHWPKTVTYLPGTVVDLNFDFDSMLMKAKWYEKKYGEDKGHGWLLRHPIKKLKRYQDYRGIAPTTDPFKNE